MIAGRHSEDYSPITWVGRVPIYATTLLVVAHVLSMIGVTIALSAADPANPLGPTLLTPFIYSSVGVLQEYKLWQFLTYAFVNAPGISFAIDMFLLYMFGREVERFLGRSAFLKLYVALLLVPPAAVTLLAYFNFPAALFTPAGATMAGSFEVHFAIFMAFVVIYPNAEMAFLRIQMKWIAAILLAIYTLQDIANHLWLNLGVLWLECACVVLMLKFAGVANASFDAWLPARDEDEPKPRRKLAAPKPEPNLHESIDPLLEKISKQGIGSLTKRERQQLEQARDALLEQDKRR